MAGFKKALAFQTCVIRRNRGSSGEGILIIKRKAGNHCNSYSERLNTDDEVMDLMNLIPVL